MRNLLPCSLLARRYCVVGPVAAGRSDHADRDAQQHTSTAPAWRPTQRHYDAESMAEIGCTETRDYSACNVMLAACYTATRRQRCGQRRSRCRPRRRRGRAHQHGPRCDRRPPARVPSAAWARSPGHHAPAQTADRAGCTKGGTPSGRLPSRARWHPGRRQRRQRERWRAATSP